MTSEDDIPCAEGPATPICFGALSCTNDALRRATRQLGVLYDEAFASSGLKATQFGLLLRIEQLGGEEGPTLQVVAGSVGVGLSALTHALRPLLRDGLVELGTDARDRRAKRAVLTALGRRRLDEGKRLWRQANGRVEALLGPADAEHLRRLADRVSSDAFLAAFREPAIEASAP